MQVRSSVLPELIQEMLDLLSGGKCSLIGTDAGAEMGDKTCADESSLPFGEIVPHRMLNYH